MGATMRSGHHFGKSGQVVNTLKFAKGGTVKTQVSRRPGMPTRAASAARSMPPPEMAGPAMPMGVPPPAMAPRGRRAGPPAMSGPPPGGPPMGAATGSFKKGGAVGHAIKQGMVKPMFKKGGQVGQAAAPTVKAGEAIPLKRGGRAGC